MTKQFSGFPEGKPRLTVIPSQFFSELLPEIDHLGELKLALYFFWSLDRMEGEFRYLKETEIAADQRFMSGMGETDDEARTNLREALERLVSRGMLLQAGLETDGQDQSLYFLNSPKGRAAIEAITRGDWRPTGDEHAPVELVIERPNIYRLYEQNIGPLTPMIAEALRDAEESFPPEWIEEAVRIAVENNARSWRYIDAILERWNKEGRHEQKDRRDTEKDRRRYVEGEFSDFIEH